MHFICNTTGAGFLSARGGVTWTGRVFSVPCACGSLSLGYLQGRGRVQPETSPPPTCHRLPAAHLNLWTGKRPSPQKLLQDPLLSASEKTSVSSSVKTMTGNVLCVTYCSPAAPKAESGGEGAVTGLGRLGRLGYRSAASAGRGSLVRSTSCSGLNSLGFICNRKC